MSRHPRRVWCTCPGLMSLGATPQRKFGATDTTGGTVVMSADTTARTSGTGVTMGEGIAITGGTERLQWARWVQGLKMLSCKG